MLTLIIVMAMLVTDPYIQDGYHPPEGYESAQEAVSEPQAVFRPPTPREPGTEQWRPLVAGHFEPSDVERVLCLMGFESGGDPGARNPSSGAAGLMQVMPFWADEFGIPYSDLFLPEVNLWAARQILDQQGWRAWDPYKRGECR